LEQKTNNVSPMDSPTNRLDFSHARSIQYDGSIRGQTKWDKE
jgi:hypothetical protein